MTSTTRSVGAVPGKGSWIAGGAVVSRRRLWPWAAACAVPTGVLAIVSTHDVSPVDADAWGDCNSDVGCRPDTSNHTYCWGNSFTSQRARDASDYAFKNLDSQTAMTTQKVDCSGLTDAVWVRTTDPDVDGSYSCQAFNSAGECERASVRLNFGNMSSDSDWKQSACHETGHSVGLRHFSTTDCMGTNPNLTQYGSHHKGHINCKCDNP